MTTDVFDNLAETSLSAADHLSVLNLCARYCHSVDAGDTDAWVDCFTDDGILEFVADGVAHRGHDELRAFVTRFSRRRGVTHHFTTDLEIRAETENRWRARSSLLLVAAGDPSTLVMSGRYHDDVVRTENGWRFRSRRLVADQGSR
ncbi:nuclear transport factor 2 family protein [Gordonia rhizosphera]|uniref:SnoaL-like domain-containing protein n=1 Tax=Gordonia rhizosphera NBRC 16068 TaxID=1108045 RepID=K6WJP4_9ACTN|nr:nuclear transport factor 2 family protein [Gordonia rhizosphera]GAB92357.1 hypothetical protein GORHZ_171_00300 [Gordonia rhizosphera NBRC 16068]